MVSAPHPLQQLLHRVIEVSQEPTRTNYSHPGQHKDERDTSGSETAPVRKTLALRPYGGA